MTNDEYKSGADKLGMSVNDYKEWLNYADQQKNLGINVAYSTDKIDTRNSIDINNRNTNQSETLVMYDDGPAIRKADGTLKPITIDEYNYRKAGAEFSNTGFTGEEIQTNNQKLQESIKYMKMKSNDITNDFIKQGYSAEEAKGMTVAKLAEFLGTNVPTGYINGHVLNHDGYSRSAPENTTFSWKSGADANPNMDCSGFVSAVLYGMGAPSALHDGPSNNGVENIINRNDLLKNVDPNNVSVGDIAYTGNKDHILIVSEVKDGKATKYWHSSPYDYRYDPAPYVGQGAGIQNTPFNHRTGVFYKRFK